MKTTILKIGIFAVIFIVPIGWANAQEKYHLGVQGTPHVSWMVNADDRDNPNFESVGTILGSFGITGECDFTENTGIGIDVLYSLQGQRYKLSGTERIKKVDYVKIPVMIVYKYEITPEAMFIGKLGPQAGILANARLTDKDGNNIVSDQKSAYEDFEFSGVAMGGFGFKLDEKFFIDAMLRFDYGFTDAENKDYKANINDPTGNIEGVNITNRATTNNTTAGVTIGLKYQIK